jgi:hypothetical protein
MAITYEPIATNTLGSATASITFSSIPATYTDLRIVVAGTPTSGSFMWMRYNSDSTTKYSVTILSGDGSSTASAAISSAAQLTCKAYSSDVTTQPTLYEIDIFSYAGSTFKTHLCSTSADYNGSGDVQRIVGLYRSTSAITSVTLLRSASDTFAAGTTATLYGIKNA